MKPVNYVAINGSTGNATSAPIPAQFAIYGSCQGVTTGTIAGTLKVQFSNDRVQVPFVPLNWSDIPSATVAITGTSGAFAIPKFEVSYEWLQVVFTASGGAGTLTATYKGTDY